MKKQKSSVKVKITALSAMLCALGTVILFFGGMMGDLDLTVSAVASLIILVAMIEMGIKSGILIYAVTSAIALILFPAYYITPMYILFVGFYPLLKYFAEKKKRVLSYLIKLGVLNVMLGLLLLLAEFVYGIDVSSMEIGELQLGNWVILLTYVAANITMLIFDYCLTKLILLYNLKFRQILKIYKFLK